MEKINEFNTYLREFNTLSTLVKFLLAVILGGSIGLDRSRKGRAAGIKTHILVCLSSTLIMTLSLYINETFKTQGDIGRLGAQVISGIGFLGAGTIIVTGNNKIKGLTTAASLWACACIGLTIGIGFYEGGILCSIIIIIVFVTMKNSNEFIDKNSGILELYIEISTLKSVRKIVQSVRYENAKLLNIEITNSVPGTGTKAIIAIIQFSKESNQDEFIESLSELDGVKHIEEF